MIEVRRRKSMVLDPADPNARSVGSFFMNPVVSGRRRSTAWPRASSRDGVAASADEIPHYPGGPERVKLSAAWLIERAGFARATGGGRSASPRSTPWPSSTAAGRPPRTSSALAREVRDGVRDRFGVALHPEPVFVGIGLD